MNALATSRDCDTVTHHIVLRAAKTPTVLGSEVNPGLSRVLLMVPCVYWQVCSTVNGAR
jgi:hypothetical protein